MNYEASVSTFTMDDGHCLCPKCAGSTLKATRYRVDGDDLPEDLRGKFRHLVPSCATCGFTPSYLSFLNSANRRANNLSSVWDMFVISLPYHHAQLKIGTNATAKSAKVASLLDDADTTLLTKAFAKSFSYNAESFSIEALSPVLLTSLQHTLFIEPSFFGDYVRTQSVPRPWAVALTIAANGIRAKELLVNFDEMRIPWETRGKDNITHIHGEFATHLLEGGFLSQDNTIENKWLGIVDETEMRSAVSKFTEFRPFAIHSFLTK